MGMFFKDVFKHCPACGSAALVRQDVNRYYEDPKDPHKILSEPLCTQLRCANCGEIVFKAGALDHILD